jgi:hypothetical protein
MTNSIKERQFCRNSAVLTVARGYCHNATYLSAGSLCRTNITAQWNVHFITPTFPYTYLRKLKGPASQKVILKSSAKLWACRLLDYIAPSVCCFIPVYSLPPIQWRLFRSAGRLWFQQHCIEIFIVASLSINLKLYMEKPKIISSPLFDLLASQLFVYHNARLIPPKNFFNIIHKSSPLTARSKAWNCDRSLAGIMGFESRPGYGCMFLVDVVCCQVGVIAMGWSFFRRSPTDCGASECDRDA